MRVVGVTMRVVVSEERNERLDAIDQRWFTLLRELGYAGVTIPNVGTEITGWLDSCHVDALILSGGNDLVEYGGDAPERDATENALLSWATSESVPVVGVCRGMQMIAVGAGGRLARKRGHAGTTHTLFGDLKGEVVSHHEWCLEDTPQGFAVLASAEDGSVEAVRGDCGRILGLMWHPERAAKIRPCDAKAMVGTLG